MIELWIAIILLTILAMAFICWPLLRILGQGASTAIDRQQQNISMFEQRLSELKLEREQGVLAEDDFAALQLELEKTLLSDASATTASLQPSSKVSRPQLIGVLALCALLPAIALGFYAKYGSAEELMWSAKRAQLQQSPSEKPTAEQAVAMLEADLARNPDNAEGWFMLAGAYMGSGQFKRGAQSYANVLLYLAEETPQYASIIGQYAQALYFVDNKVTARVQVQISRALKLDANEVLSLGLLGIDAFEAEQYQLAIKFWKKSLLNAKVDAAEALRAGIAKAQERLQGEVVIVDEHIANLSVVVDVQVTDEIKAQLGADTLVFVFAKAIGGRMPLAAVKLRLSELPKRLILDDSMAMMPSVKISLQKKVQVSARISMSGQPQAQQGDFESEVIFTVVSETQDPVKLLINKVVK